KANRPMTHRQEFKELSKLEPPSSSKMSREGTCLLAYWPGGSRCLGGMSSVWALVRNVRTPSQCCTLRPGGLLSSLWMQREMTSGKHHEKEYRCQSQGRSRP